MLLMLLTPACATRLGYDDLREGFDDTGAAETEMGIDADAAAPGPARPPQRPPGEPVPSGKGRSVYLAVRKLYLASKTREDLDTPTAWREWGFDLDRVCTGEAESKANVGTCRRADTADQSVLIDGDLCRDNNWGSQVMPMLRKFAPNVEDKAATSLNKGSATMLLRIDDLDDGEDDPYAPARLYQIAKIDSPKWDGSDLRPILADSLVDGDIENARDVFPGGNVQGHAI